MLRSALEALGPTNRVYSLARAVRHSRSTAYWTGISLLPLERRRRVLYRKYHGRDLRLDPPVRISEKVNWRIVHDRRPLLAWTCDKLRMKEYAAGFPGLEVPRTLWAGTDVGELAEMSFPERWVLKPNHRSGLVHLGQGQPTRKELAVLTSGWLKDFQTARLGEWAYGQAQPCILAEEWIGDGDAVPTDYKFYVFDGVPAAIQVHTGRFGEYAKRFYRPDWTPVDGTDGPLAPRPAALDEMLELAGALGAPFDFMRIDLFWTRGKVYFGETTPYPAGGLVQVRPDSLDVELGALWTLPDLHA